MNLYGLIGMPLSQSFSKRYFTEKFEKEQITGVQYDLFPLGNIAMLNDLLSQYPNLKGLNVTIPYKEQVLSFLQQLDRDAETIGAVNCIKISNRSLTGYNADAPAFKHTLLPLLQPHHTQALILGTGGASKAVAYVLKNMGITYAFVSRHKGKASTYVYEDLNQEIMTSFSLIINTTPLGSYPKVGSLPNIPYRYLSEKNYLYDLVYNPTKTLFLQKGEERGAIIKNGYDMLVGQAERSWDIWNEERIVEQ